jgi:hypothetical protein
MKNIKQIRESYDLITEKEEKEDRKLSALVRAGLYDAKKLPALKKALDKSADKMTSQEKRMLLNLLDSLISQVTSDDQVYRKVRQNVQHVNESKKDDTYSKFDSRVNQGYPSDKDIPAVLILKRKAIRVYPDNQKVALYYSQALDKYVTIPFSDIQAGLNEEQIDELWTKIAQSAPMVFSGLSKLRNLRRAKKPNTGSGVPSVPGKGKRPNRPNKPKRKRKTDDDTFDVDPTVVVNSPGSGSGDVGGYSGSAPVKRDIPQYNFQARPTTHSGEKHINLGDTPVERERAARLARQTQQASLRKESVLHELKSMIDNDIAEKTMVINEQQININNTVAKKIVLVYESVNSVNKKKMEKMLNESAASFNKVLTFALRQ